MLAVRGRATRRGHLFVADRRLGVSSVRYPILPDARTNKARQGSRFARQEVLHSSLSVRGVTPRRAEVYPVIPDP